MISVPRWFKRSKSDQYFVDPRVSAQPSLHRYPASQPPNNNIATTTTPSPSTTLSTPTLVTSPNFSNTNSTSTSTPFLQSTLTPPPQVSHTIPQASPTLKSISIGVTPSPFTMMGSTPSAPTQPTPTQPPPTATLTPSPSQSQTTSQIPTPSSSVSGSTSQSSTNSQPISSNASIQQLNGFHRKLSLERDDIIILPNGTGTNIRQHLRSDLPKREFIQLELSSQTPHEGQIDAQKIYNRDKNRYTNILPWDSTRVRLTPIEGIEGSDYINANFIDGETSGSKRAYIATQGPLAHTKRDFWRMVWEQKSPIIVMLGKDREGDRIKVDRYWPEEGEPPLTISGVLGNGGNLGDLSIHFLEKTCDHEQHIITRKLQLHHHPTLETREIIQFHYEGWPDHGVPHSTVPVRNLMKNIDNVVSDVKEKDKEERPPITVHCSAGVGRTGAFVTMLMTHEKLRELANETKNPVVHFNLYKTVQFLRTQRPGMVQQQEQYLFCYEVLAAEAEELGIGVVTSSGELSCSPHFPPTSSRFNSSLSSSSSSIPYRTTIDSIDDNR
eukprot:TRINITY_DN5361_c0_g2_i1.p1 TRINITY_DN5361_c0_g2~~TRINITY_DN5361_c0_g2_i1.p1  ORF type:complete len:553 (-),score=128.97 TRINITY_DN5361_c0_g2_i1:143-1801(-)